MPTRDEILKEKTYKAQGLDFEQRVMYVLKDGTTPENAAWRKEMAITLLLKLLHERDLLSEDDLDDFLFALAR